MQQEILDELITARAGIRQILRSIERKISSFTKTSPSPTERREDAVRRLTKIILEKYDFCNGATRWETCSNLCIEMGIEPTRANSSSVGMALEAMNLPYRKSNGKLFRKIPELKK